MKTCTKCGESKDESNFDKKSKNGKRPGLRAACRPCRLIEGREYNKRNPDTYKNAYLKYQYGVDLTVWNELVQIQEGRCAICGVHQTETKRAFSVDHDHETGEVRGLLCQPCNMGLGGFRDNLESLEKAKVYLLRSRLKVVKIVGT